MEVAQKHFNILHTKVFSTGKYFLKFVSLQKNADVHEVTTEIVLLTLTKTKRKPVT